MSEEIIEWRDAWKILIDASKSMILNGDKNDTKPFDSLTTLQNDKMLLFEKAIAFECLGNTEKAKELYKLASDEKTGLPVAHWRKRAKFFYDRLERRNGLTTIDIDTTQSCFNVQWDVYYNMHYYSYIDDYIRYLAISSVSRVYSEPAMAIVIFRTCLEIGLWTYFERTVEVLNRQYKLENKKNKNLDIGLDRLLKEMKEIYDNENNHLFLNKEYKYHNEVRKAGNDAAHPGKIKEAIPFVYKDTELINILYSFDRSMYYLNEHAKSLFMK